MKRACYYTITLRPRTGTVLLSSNNERAFIVSLLQDVLRRHSLLENPTIRHQLAGYIDLLAFSITRERIQLVLFSVTYPVVPMLARYITQCLSEYQSEWATVNESAAAIRTLAGPHHALDTTIALHLNHPDWEYDRYSSIGFYLHDRRGDWVHLWRLSSLYENNPDIYRSLVYAKQNYSPSQHHSALATSPRE